MNKLKNIVILAGGDGDRFLPLADKNLVEFCGLSLLEHIIGDVQDKAEKIYVVVNADNREMIENKLGTKVTYLFQKKGMEGMGGALLSCEGTVSGETLVLNSSDYLNFDVLEKVVQAGTQKPFILVARKTDRYFPGGYVKVENGKLMEIVEKPIPGSEPSDLVRLVVDYYSDLDLILAELKKAHTKNDDLYEQGFNALISQGKADFVTYDDYLYCLKYSWHVLPLMNHFLFAMEHPSVDSSATISSHAILTGPIHIGKRVKIGDYSKIVGPCYINDDAIIGDYAMIRESQIGKGSIIGGYSEVTRSYVGAAVSLHRNYVGDSVLSEGVTMGAGAVTANYRFDAKSVRTPIGGKIIDMQRDKCGLIAGKKVRIGVNAATYPGVKLSAGAIVLPGEVVVKDR